MPPVGILPVEKRTAFDPTGRPVEGMLPDGLCERHGLKNGVLLLLNGVEGRDTGFGLKHIEAKLSRVKQLSGLGFNSVHGFVRFVFQSYSAISLQRDGRLILVAERKADYLWVICQWDESRSVWSVTTAIPKRHNRGLEFIWTAKKGDETA